jgi:hypothetical protein
MDWPGGKPQGFHLPMPANYIEAVCRASRNNPHADVHLWMDFERLNADQIAYMRQRFQEQGSPNLELKNLRDIPAYSSENLFNQNNASFTWRAELKHDVIWRQVDAAKILICLQGDQYEQTFFADLDFAAIEIKDPFLQNTMQKYGLLVRGTIDLEAETAFLENQAWGFVSARKPLFAEIYRQTLTDAYEGFNGYSAFVKNINAVTDRECINIRNLIYFGFHDQTEAHHPEHPFDPSERSVKKPAQTTNLIKLSSTFVNVVLGLKKPSLSGGNSQPEATYSPGPQS